VADSAPLSTEELQQLCDYLYRRTGMMFTENKRYYVERRVAERMLATGAPTFANYFSRLRANLDAEIELFINAFTVNETYFYREDHQLKCLTGDLLPDRIRHRRAGSPVRIWSAPCSTGEEPYTIAVWLLENWDLVDAYDIEIVGSDIDTEVLSQARTGIFGKRALMKLPPSLIEKYFVELQDGRWQILDELRQSVQFTPVNLVESSDTRRFGQFDVIFCRNVLIYFDDASRRTAAENLFENLLPGGFICLGHTESMSRISPLFEVRRFSDAIVYQRPGEISDDAV
jgi:chemotaxis protein methyltransferase CheR